MIEQFSVRGQAAVLIAPTEKTPKVVVYTHGSGERVENIFRDPKKEPVFKTLLGAGYAIATTDAHGDNWGSAASAIRSRSCASCVSAASATSTCWRCRWAASTGLR